MSMGHSMSMGHTISMGQPMLAGHIMSAGQPTSTEGELMLRPNSQMQLNHPYSAESSMHSALGSTMPYHQQHALQHAVAPEGFGANASFTDGESQLLDYEEADEVEAPRAAKRARTSSKPTSSKSSANNEREMRHLFQSNKHRTLSEVAADLHGNERGPTSERARQIFAMLWLHQSCSRGEGKSVPRNDVYTSYAAKCAAERITILNPASFGKLVRVIYPAVRTRRLGVRGGSKYHYVSFALINGQPDLPPAQPALPLAVTAQSAQTHSAAQSQSPALNDQESALPSPALLAQQPDTQASTLSAAAKEAQSLFNQPDISNIDQLGPHNSKTKLRLAFVDEAYEPRNKADDPIILPSIEPFLPPKTDLNVARSLPVLYLTHCTSLIDDIRFCKEEDFFHHHHSFLGTLTAPNQKLLKHESIAPWIEECDFVLYKRVMQIIAEIALQAIPKSVLNTLRTISERLVLHIRDSYQGLPKHTLDAKEAPATLFAGLLDRALRVNLTAHAAANMLLNPANRDQMYMDWILTVRLLKVAENVPTRGMDDVARLLLEEIRGLVHPQNVPWEVETLTIYGDLLQSQDAVSTARASDGVTLDNVLDGWVVFLRSLQGRFPYATPAEIVKGVERVGNTVMRDITMSQGKSFGSWWVTKCWIDEMVSFLAEYGGFIQTRTTNTSVAGIGRPSATIPVEGHQDLQLGSSSRDSNVSRLAQLQPDRAPFLPHPETHGQDSIHPSANPDDSGIGIRTPEEDFPLDKFDFQENGSQNLQSPGPGPALP
ncbi:RFX DNA-binding domain-containing protein [Hypoxylon sp. NC1633]|nr:RFX DNA-binding domain-containing protein [Hypoxylon sp. NC1633]